jgi:hypothetical protein
VGEEPLALAIFFGDYRARSVLKRARLEGQRFQMYRVNSELRARFGRRRANLMGVVALACVLLGIAPASAAEQPATGAGSGGIAIELNKLEPQASQCRAYFVVTNKNTANYQELKLDLVLFRPDGVIGRRFAVDLAPLKSDKRTVKLFELADTACDDVGSFLINEVMECRADSGPVEDCLKDISVSSLTKAQLTK